jgi:hypothetical protein
LTGTGGTKTQELSPSAQSRRPEGYGRTAIPGEVAGETTPKCPDRVIARGPLGGVQSGLDPGGRVTDETRAPASASWDLVVEFPFVHVIWFPAPIVCSPLTLYGHRPMGVVTLIVHPDGIVSDAVAWGAVTWLYMSLRVIWSWQAAGTNTSPVSPNALQDEIERVTGIDTVVADVAGATPEI